MRSSSIIRSIFHRGGVVARIQRKTTLPYVSFLTSSQAFSSSNTSSSEKEIPTIASQFYRVWEDSQHEYDQSNSQTIVGEIIDQSIDLKTIRPGEKILVPYELTINPAFRDFWQSAFYSHDRINTSTPFARELGLQDQVIPFGLMLFLAGTSISFLLILIPILMMFPPQTRPS